MKRQIISGLAAVAAMASVTPAFAGTASGTLTSTLNVVTTCTIGAGGGNALLDFGTVPAQTLTSPINADTGTTLTVNCDGNSATPTLAIGVHLDRHRRARAEAREHEVVGRGPEVLARQLGGLVRHQPMGSDRDVLREAMTDGGADSDLAGRVRARHDGPQYARARATAVAEGCAPAPCCTA